MVQKNARGEVQMIVRNLWKCSLEIRLRHEELRPSYSVFYKCFWKSPFSEFHHIFKIFLGFPIQLKLLVLPFHLKRSPLHQPSPSSNCHHPTCIFSSHSFLRAGRKLSHTYPSNQLISLLQSSPLTFSSATVPSKNNKIHKKLGFLEWRNDFANISDQFLLASFSAWAVLGRKPSVWLLREQRALRMQKIIFWLILGAFSMDCLGPGVQENRPHDEDLIVAGMLWDNHWGTSLICEKALTT